MILRLSEAAVLSIGLAVVVVRFGLQAGDRRQVILVCLGVLGFIAFCTFFWAQWGMGDWAHDIYYQLCWLAMTTTTIISPDPIRWLRAQRRKPVVCEPN